MNCISKNREYLSDLAGLAVDTLSKQAKSGKRYNIDDCSRVDIGRDVLDYEQSKLFIKTVMGKTIHWSTWDDDIYLRVMSSVNHSLKGELFKGMENVSLQTHLFIVANGFAPDKNGNYWEFYDSENLMGGVMNKKLEIALDSDQYDKFVSAVIDEKIHWSTWDDNLYFIANSVGGNLLKGYIYFGERDDHPAYLLSHIRNGFASDEDGNHWEYYDSEDKSNEIEGCGFLLNPEQCKSFANDVMGKKIHWSTWPDNVYFIANSVGGDHLEGHIYYSEMDGHLLYQGPHIQNGFAPDENGNYWEYYDTMKKSINKNYAIGDGNYWEYYDNKIKLEDTMKESIIKNYEKTEDAVLVHEEFGRYNLLSDSFIEELIMGQFKDQILAEAKRRKTAREDDCE